MKQYRVWFTNGSAQIVTAKDAPAAAKKACQQAGWPLAEVSVEDLPCFLLGEDLRGVLLGEELRGGKHDHKWT